jgi:hypothetical protein
MDMDRPDNLRNQLLDAASERSARHTQYQEEVRIMLSNYEKRVRIEGRIVVAQWIFLVLLTTAFMLIGGWKHQTMTGMWFLIQGVFWFLFGVVFLLMHRFNKLSLEMLTEIKRVETAVLELKEAIQAK